MVAQGEGSGVQKNQILPLGTMNLYKMLKWSIEYYGVIWISPTVMDAPTVDHQVRWSLDSVNTVGNTCEVQWTWKRARDEILGRKQAQSFLTCWREMRCTSWQMQEHKRWRLKDSDFHSGNTESRMMQSHILAGVSGSPLGPLSSFPALPQSWTRGGRQQAGAERERENRKSV